MNRRKELLDKYYNDLDFKNKAEVVIDRLTEIIASDAWKDTVDEAEKENIEINDKNYDDLFNYFKSRYQHYVFSNSELDYLPKVFNSIADELVSELDLTQQDVDDIFDYFSADDYNCLANDIDISDYFIWFYKNY